MNAKERKKLARAIAHRAECMKDVNLERSVGLALTGCSSRVYKAISTTPPREVYAPSADNMCLPDVAIFSAGHRKSNGLTAR